MITSRTLRAALALAAATSLAAYSLAQAEVKVADTSRIVAIGGDVTEILYALKTEARIAAVDSTSQFPPEALKDKKNVYLEIP
jgi:heme transport system substrate-binding protein